MGGFGNRLQDARKKKKFTLEKLAEVCNMSEATLRNYEKSRQFPNTETLTALCNALETTPNLLLQDELDFDPADRMDALAPIIEKLSDEQYDHLIALLRAFD